MQNGSPRKLHKGTLPWPVATVSFVCVLIQSPLTTVEMAQVCPRINKQGQNSPEASVISICTLSFIWHRPGKRNASGLGKIWSSGEFDWWMEEELVITTWNFFFPWCCQEMLTNHSVSLSVSFGDILFEGKKEKIPGRQQRVCILLQPLLLFGS